MDYHPKHQSIGRAAYPASQVPFGRWQSTSLKRPQKWRYGCLFRPQKECREPFPTSMLKIACIWHIVERCGGSYPGFADPETENVLQYPQRLALTLLLLSGRVHRQPEPRHIHPASQVYVWLNTAGTTVLLRPSAGCVSRNRS